MNSSQEHASPLTGFPAALRALVLAELAAGNTIAEWGHGFPAAPCGAWLRLGQAVTTHPRQPTPELDFFERNNSTYSGEFTDAQRYFFVLEPPLPPAAPPDMDAIRAAMAPPQTPVSLPSPPTANPAHSRNSLVERFRASMEINYDRWREGTGYDLTLLAAATPEEIQELETLLIPRRTHDWRDVEALAALDTEPARHALRKAFQTGNSRIRLAVQRHAPDLLTRRQRADSLVRALREVKSFDGLSEALLEVEDFHPPEVVQALLDGLLERDGGTAVHFAAMLFYLHGQSTDPFDWALRPFFLRFNTEDPDERKLVTRELCETLGIPPTC